jgi:hypothetical protein
VASLLPPVHQAAQKKQRVGGGHQGPKGASLDAFEGCEEGFESKEEEGEMMFQAVCIYGSQSGGLARCALRGVWLMMTISLLAWRDRDGA